MGLYQKNLDSGHNKGLKNVNQKTCFKCNSMTNSAKTAPSQKTSHTLGKFHVSDCESGNIKEDTQYFVTNQVPAKID